MVIVRIVSASLLLIPEVNDDLAMASTATAAEPTETCTPGCPDASHRRIPEKHGDTRTEYGDMILRML